jgi:hypothetical protein
MAYVGSAGVAISVPVAKTISRRVEDAGLLDFSPGRRCR